MWRLLVALSFVLSCGDGNLLFPWEGDGCLPRFPWVPGVYRSNGKGLVKSPGHPHATAEGPKTLTLSKEPLPLGQTSEIRPDGMVRSLPSGNDGTVRISYRRAGVLVEETWRLSFTGRPLGGGNRWAEP